MTDADLLAFFGNETPKVSPVDVNKEGIGIPGPDFSLGMMLRHADGKPWAGAPVRFNISTGRRLISRVRNTPPYVRQITLLTNADGVAKVYLQPDPDMQESPDSKYRIIGHTQ
jgi:hypothetical protein